VALQLSLQAMESPVGIYLPAAYVRISSITLVDSRASIIVLTYASDVAFGMGASPIKVENYSYDTFDQSYRDSVKNQLYAWLKTQDRYKSASDVL
jgi:hypothetical protein